MDGVLALTVRTAVPWTRLLLEAWDSVARPDNSARRRAKLLPIVAGAFAELGYRRTTTAELARRCQVQENTLYRLWPDKKQMFLASIDHVYRESAKAWAELLAGESSRSTTAQRLLRYESAHHGEHGLYRIVFAGLSEADDPEIHDKLQSMYARFHRFIRRQIIAHRRANGAASPPTANLAAWAIVGLGTVANIGREFDLFNEGSRKRLLNEIGRLLLDGET